MSHGGGRAKAKLLVLLLGVFLSNLGQGKVKEKPADHPKVDESQYVGSEACQACHEDVYKHFEATAHYKTLIYDGWTANRRGCEACHGPGREHVETGGDRSKVISFTGISPKAVAEACLKCHENQEERNNFRRSEHGMNSVSCIACHSPHQAKRAEFLLRDATPALCYSCHGEIKSDFAMPFHHKVPEGSMKCTDCHNQHGGFNPKQMRAATGTDLICFKCHSDKQGPFVFEHAPVKVEGCMICHVPHGTTNARMLRRNEVRFLCLECHSNTPGIPGERAGLPTPAFHNIATPRFQNCTTCHVNIHGSNLNKLFFE